VKEEKCIIKFWLEKGKEGDHLKDLGIDGMIMLK
jgi:hypothetical protein